MIHEDERARYQHYSSADASWIEDFEAASLTGGDFNNLAPQNDVSLPPNWADMVLYSFDHRDTILRDWNGGFPVSYEGWGYSGFPVQTVENGPPISNRNHSRRNNRNSRSCHSNVVHHRRQRVEKKEPDEVEDHGDRYHVAPGQFGEEDPRDSEDDDEAYCEVYVGDNPEYWKSDRKSNDVPQDDYSDDDTASLVSQSGKVSSKASCHQNSAREQTRTNQSAGIERRKFKRRRADDKLEYEVQTTIHVAKRQKVQNIADSSSTSSNRSTPSSSSRKRSKAPIESETADDNPPSPKRQRVFRVQRIFYH